MRRLLTCALSLAIGLGIFASPEATTTASFMTSFSLSQTALRFRETFGLETDPVILAEETYTSTSMSLQLLTVMHRQGAGTVLTAIRTPAGCSARGIKTALRDFVRQPATPRRIGSWSIAST
jgi:hypothetical protein